MAVHSVPMIMGRSSQPDSCKNVSKWAPEQDLSPFIYKKLVTSSVNLWTSNCWRKMKQLWGQLLKGRDSSYDYLTTDSVYIFRIFLTKNGQKVARIHYWCVKHCVRWCSWTEDLTLQWFPVQHRQILHLKFAGCLKNKCWILALVISKVICHVHEVTSFTIGIMPSKKYEHSFCSFDFISKNATRFQLCAEASFGFLSLPARMSHWHWVLALTWSRRKGPYNCPCR